MAARTMLPVGEEMMVNVVVVCLLLMGAGLGILVGMFINEYFNRWSNKLLDRLAGKK